MAASDKCWVCGKITNNFSKVKDSDIKIFCCEDQECRWIVNMSFDLEGKI